ncbi:MAG: PKD domain-containing protein [Bacteroidota bacterium]
MKTKFNRFYVYCFILITLFFGVNNYVYAQCSYDNTLDTTWVAPGSLGDSVSTDCIYAGKFIRVTGMVSGEVYQISTCGNTNFDSQITIYPAGGGSPVGYNDDACGLQSEIIFIPPTNGDYDVLIDEYHCGQANTTCMNLLIKNIPCPEINFVNMNVSSDTVCPDDNVDFDVYVSGGAVSSYLWDFGDGNTSSQQYTSHNYTSAGTYEVSLTLTNGCGNDTVLYDTVHVMNNLPFTADYIDMYVHPYSVCPDDNVNFDVDVSGNPVSSCLWDFGDGSTSSQEETSHSYTSAGTYDVSLTLTNGCGNDTVLYHTIQVLNDLPFTADYIDMYVHPYSVCPDDNVNFDVDVSGNPVSSCLWDFGDGSTSSQEETSHSYTSAGTYDVSLTLTNGCGNDTVLYDTVHVMNNLPFTADYIDMDVNPAPVCPDDNVNFDVDVSGYVSSYLWDFGDGNTSGQEETSHSYTSAGTYDVSLTLTNGCGNDTVLYHTINVDNNVNPNPAYYMYDVIPYEACPGDNVLFIVYPSGSSYLWDFGDGNTTTLTTEYEINGSIYDIAKHAYSSTGNYTVMFTLTNGCGNSFTDYFNVDIDDNIPVDGWFWWDSDNPAVNENIEFFALGGSSYQWDFGDGSAVITSTSSLTPVMHSYSSQGDYTISVTITNSCGNSETYTDIISIDPVGIQNNNVSDNDFLNIYPNPNNGSFTLEIENNDKEKLMLQIMNITGQIIYTKQLEDKSNITHKIDLSDYSKGIFLVKVQSEKKYEIKKVIIY